MNPLIPLSFRPTTDLMGPRDIISLQDFAQRSRLFQQQQQEKTQIQAFMQQPGGLDPDGTPSLQTIGRISTLNPQLGIQMRGLKDQASLRNFQNNERKTEATLPFHILRVSTYDKAIKEGKNPTVALQEANAAFTGAVDQAESDGSLASILSPQEIAQGRSNGTGRPIELERALIMQKGGKIPGQMSAYEQARIDQEERRTRVQEDREKRQGTGAVGGSPQGTMMQDPDTGTKYLVGKGKAWKATEDGTWEPTNPNNLPKRIGKVGNIGTAGSRENVFTQRLIQAGNQASKDLENVVKLPITVDRGPYGAFGSVTSPSFMDAGKVVLANKMTTEEQQVYNAMSTGFQRTLAAIESAGLMPSGSLTHQMDAVIFKPGDTNLTKLHKLAQTRQIVESGMEVVEANPRISDSEKEKVREVVQRLKSAVPFTHSDLIELVRAQQTNPQITMREIMRKKELERKRDGANP